MTRRWLWAPLLIGAVGAILFTVFETPIGQALGLPDGDPFGYFGVVLYGGAPTGLVAALASRSWRGGLAMLLGMAIAGAPLGASVAGSPGDMLKFSIAAAAFWPLSMGFLGVPVYLATTAVIRAVVRVRNGTAGAPAPAAAPSDNRTEADVKDS
jgi:hypothetical protein